MAYNSSLHPKLPQMMIQVLPGGPAPVLLCQFPEDGVFFSHDRGLAETVQQIQQFLFFFFKIMGGAGHDKGRVGGEPLFIRLVIPEFGFE